MIEDSELSEFVKSRLEEGLDGEPPRLAAIERLAEIERFARTAERRSRWRAWSGSSLVAATLAVACSFAVLFIREEPAPESTVARVIDLLRASDGDTSELDEGESVAEMLLAWQDAPYESAISGLSSGN